MTITIDDPLGAFVVLVVIMLAIWAITYSAARTANMRGPDMVPPSFAALAVAGENGIHLTLANLGTVPAFLVTVHWADATHGDPIATTNFLSPLAPLEWDVPSSPDEGPRMRDLTVTWRTKPEPWAGRRLSWVAVLVPSGPDGT